MKLKYQILVNQNFNKNTIVNTEAKGTLIYMSPELV